VEEASGGVWLTGMFRSNVKRASPLGERASEANVHVIRPFGSPLPLQSLHFLGFARRPSRILGGPME
jgi:hypothetical protein